MQYHVEIFKDRYLRGVQADANAYLEEIKELRAVVTDTDLRYLDEEYYLIITLAIPTKEEV